MPHLIPPRAVEVLSKERYNVGMITVYYTYYTPISNYIPDVTKQEHTLGRRLLAHGLQELFHVTVGSLEDLEGMLKIAENGKPYLKDYPNVFFSITHCDGLVACALGETEIGMDAELIQEFPEILIKRAFSEKEKDLLHARGVTPDLHQEWFFRHWTLKEAYVKKTGVGVDTNLQDCSFDLTSGIICFDPTVSCDQAILPSGHILSVIYDYSSISKKRVVYLPIS